MYPRKFGDICPKVSRNLLSIEVLVQNPKNYLIFVLKMRRNLILNVIGRIDKGSGGEAPRISFDIYAVISSNLKVCRMKCKKKIMISEVNNEIYIKFFC